MFVRWIKCQTNEDYHLIICLERTCWDCEPRWRWWHFIHYNWTTMTDEWMCPSIRWFDDLMGTELFFSRWSVKNSLSSSFLKRNPRFIHLHRSSIYCFNDDLATMYNLFTHTDMHWRHLFHHRSIDKINLISKNSFLK